MKELTPKRPFKKTFEREYLRSIQEQKIPLMERAAALGLVPEPLLLVVRRKWVDLYMDRVDGFDLGRIPKRLDSLRFSTELAVEVADLCQNLYSAKIDHDDFHWANIMYDIKKRAVIAVDADSLIGEERTLQSYIMDFGDIMTSVYLGFDAYHDGPAYLMSHPEAAEYIGGFNAKVTFWEFREKYARKFVRYLFDEEGVTQKVDFRILDFILRAWEPATTPDSFDEILALK